MEGNFLGVGLTNVIGIALFTMLVSVILKVIFTKYEVEGISQVIRTAQKKEVKRNEFYFKAQLVDTNDSINFCNNDVYLFN